MTAIDTPKYPSAQPDSPDADRVVSRTELECCLDRSSETRRRWIKSGQLPRPDVAISRKTTGWRLSTLSAAGIRVV